MSDESVVISAVVISWYAFSGHTFQWFLPRTSWKSEPEWTHSTWHGTPHPTTHWSRAISCPAARWSLMSWLMGRRQHRPTPSGSVRRPGIISSTGWVSRRLEASSNIICHLFFHLLVNCLARCLYTVSHNLIWSNLNLFFFERVRCIQVKMSL